MSDDNIATRWYQNLARSYISCSNFYADLFHHRWLQSLSISHQRTAPSFTSHPIVAPDHRQNLIHLGAVTSSQLSIPVALSLAWTASDCRSPKPLRVDDMCLVSKLHLISRRPIAHRRVHHTISLSQRVYRHASAAWIWSRGREDD